MAKQSAGLLLYRMQRDCLEIFLVHPGGPYWTKKDVGAWSIPKGEFDEEEALPAAKREFYEEIGNPAPQGNYILLKPVRQKSGKIVHAWAVEGEVDAEHIRGNDFEMEWPPKSGNVQSFPEIDRAAWFSVEEAQQKINPGQVGLILELLEKVE
ncbi:MAG: NUDIX domain-containing protein [Anaerolineales bacterium]